jgi:hypothetical protein
MAWRSTIGMTEEILKEREEPSAVEEKRFAFFALTRILQVLIIKI